jgi:gamma-D-glutamyl-L-lysine dipeptidyl-peptidase
VTEPLHCIGVSLAQVWASPDAARDIDEPIVRAVPDVATWMSALDTEQRLDLLGRVETQALFGEPVLVISESNGWCEVRLPLQPTRKDPMGYPGWVRRDHIVDSTDAVTQVSVTARFARLHHTADSSAFDVLSMGCVVEALGDEAVGDAMPGDEMPGDDMPGDDVLGDAVPGVANLSAMLTVRGPQGVRYVDAAACVQRPDPIAVATDMIGLGYLWSGLSGWGVDCSGLVHLAHRVAGRIVPRDSIDQFAAAVPSTVYFRHDRGTGAIHHVAFDIGSGLMLHAPKTGRVVEVLAIATPPYDQEVVWPAVPPTPR